MRRILYSAFALCATLLPAAASAHEVYVLSPEQINTGLTTSSFSEWQVMLQNSNQFLFWAGVSGIVVFFFFFVSLWHTFEKPLDSLFSKVRPYAAPISRITIGLSLIAASYYDALFGPELPLETFGHASLVVRIVLALSGIMLTCNFYTRIAAIAMLIVFAIETYFFGVYMFTYATYFGELAALAFLARQELRPYAFLLLRVSFGVGLIYSSFYAKVLHNQLALQVASVPLAGHEYSLAHYLGFEPHFLVLGAAIIELMAGLFFILGIEIRFLSLFLLFWLSLSLSYFGESVWPHLVLVGIPIAFLCYGYDKFSLEGYLYKRIGRTPLW